ncbi:MAG TPA: hypothetical protein VML75_13830 [Kofleriaceae bacterium]|nr:hypothetical protein [Kofleriaceae bacterium]
MFHPIQKTLLTAGAIAVLGLTAATTVGGCGNEQSGENDGASCEALGAHFAELAQAEAAKLPDGDPEKKAAEAQLALIPKARAALITECREEKWSPELRACFVAARSADEFQAKCAALAKRVGGAPAAPTSDSTTPAEKPAGVTPPAPAGDPATTPATND